MILMNDKFGRKWPWLVSCYNPSINLEEVSKLMKASVRVACFRAENIIRALANAK
jgi:hypothetical protein